MFTDDVVLGKLSAPPNLTAEILLSINVFDANIIAESINYSSLSAINSSIESRSTSGLLSLIQLLRLVSPIYTIGPALTSLSDTRAPVQLFFTVNMADNTKKAPSPERHRFGEHWSGANPVPTVQKFIENLDHEKKERDRRIDEENKQKQLKAKQKQWEDTRGKQHHVDQSDVVAHKAREVSKAKMRNVTDPTTGKEIGVEDQDESSMEAVKNPMVCHLFNHLSQGHSLTKLVVDCTQCQSWTTNREFTSYESYLDMETNLETTTGRPNKPRSRVRRIQRKARYYRPS